MKIAKIEKIGKQPVYDISVKDAEHYVLENGVVTHNTGLVYSASTAFIIGKSQEKDGTDLIGWNFTLNVEKSRFVREKSKFGFTVTYESGINKYSGILDLAIACGYVSNASKGWYQLIDKETGELLGQKVRRADTETKDFLGVIMKKPEFDAFVQKQYKMTGPVATTMDEDLDAV
jgi:hypothetical protein